VFSLFLSSRYVCARAVSYLSMVAIALAVSALIIVMSVMNGFLRETRRVIRGTTADVIVSVGGQPGYPVPKQQIVEVVTGQPGVAGAAPRLIRPAVFKADRGLHELYLNHSGLGGLSTLLVLGIDPPAERGVTDLTAYLDAVTDPALRVTDLEDPFFVPRREIRDRSLWNAGAPEILVSETLLGMLGARRGSTLTLVTVPEGVDVSGDAIRSSTEQFVVSGAFRTGHGEFDQQYVFVEARDFRIWARSESEVSELYVRAEPGADLDLLRESLRARLAEAGISGRVETWEDRHAIWLGAVENERNILAFVLGLFVLLTCTITFSTLTMMVREKIRDIGILSAIGASPGSVGGVFALAGLFVSSVGGAAGLALGTLVATNLNAIKDWIEATFDIEIFRRDVYAFEEVPVEVSLGLDVAIAAATVVFGVVICLLPSWRAARMDPVEALRHE